MTERFVADFNQPDGALPATWDLKVVGFGSVAVVDQSATNVGTDAAAARLADTSILTDEQELVVAFKLAAVSVGDALYIGLGSDGDAGTPSCGFACRFRVDVGPTYFVEIISDVEASQVGSPSVTASVEVAPIAIGPSIVDVVQDLRIRLRRAAGGYELLVWFNEEDDAEPTTQHRFLRDHQTVTFGVPWFRPHSDTAGARVFVGFFEHTAYVGMSGRRVAGWRPARASTLAELRADLTTFLESRPNAPASSEARQNWAINSAQTEILNGLGDQALFLRLTETVALVQDQNTGVAELPLRVGRLLRVSIPGLHDRVEFEWLGLSESGQQMVRLPFGLSYTAALLTYEPEREPMIEDGDLAMIPADYSNVIVLRAALTLVGGDGSSRQAREMEMLYMRAERAMLKALRSKQRATRAAFTVGNLQRMGRPNWMGRR